MKAVAVKALIKSKGKDLNPFIEAAHNALTFATTRDWALIILQSAYEVLKSDNFTLLEVACLLNKYGRFDTWIAEHCSQLQEGMTQAEFLEILNNAGGIFNPLMSAVRGNALATVVLLVKIGADVTRTNTQGQNALMNAACLGYVDILDFLIENGARQAIDAKDFAGRTALYFAVEKDETVVACKLLEYGATFAHNESLESPLRMAMVRTNPEMVELLFKAGVDPNSLIYGQPALAAAIDHYALWSPDPIWEHDKEREGKALQVIKLFMNHPKIDFNARGINGISALSAANYHCFNNLKWELIDRGAVQ